jgi:hypothetical protein
MRFREMRGDDRARGENSDAPTVQIQTEDTEKGRSAGAESTEAVDPQVVKRRLEDIARDAARQQASESPGESVSHWTTAS